MTYDVGDQSQLGVTFVNALTDALADPTTVTLTVKPPKAVATVYTYGVSGELLKESVGVYNARVSITAPGKWRYRWQGTGDLEVAEEGVIFVRPSGV